MDAPDHQSGKTIFCPKCYFMMIVPGESRVEPAGSAPASSSPVSKAPLDGRDVTAHGTEVPPSAIVPPMSHSSQDSADSAERILPERGSPGLGIATGIIGASIVVLGTMALFGGRALVGRNFFSQLMAGDFFAILMALAGGLVLCPIGGIVSFIGIHDDYSQAGRIGGMVGVLLALGNAAYLLWVWNQKHVTMAFVGALGLFLFVYGIYWIWKRSG